MPPAVMALLLVYSRNHNFVAEKLLAINERGTFREWSSDPADPDVMKAEVDEDFRAARLKAMKAQKKAQDDEIFHTARLINCGYFM